MAHSADALARSAFIDQRRDQQSLRTFPREQQPPLHTIDGTYGGAFPVGRMPNSDYTLERRHFPHVSNRPTEEKEQIVRPRVEPKLTSLADRPHGTRLLREVDVYAAAKLAAATSVHGCRHFPAMAGGNPSVAAIGSAGPTRQFSTGGKSGGASGSTRSAQAPSSQETPLEATLGRITRLSESELHTRNERSHGPSGVPPIEYSRDFYKSGACVPSVVDMSKSTVQGRGFVAMDLKAKRIANNLWKQTKQPNAHTEQQRREYKTYEQAEAERELAYEQKLVSDLPDEVRAPVEEHATPVTAVESAPQPPKDESKRDKRMREKLQAKQKSIATH